MSINLKRSNDILLQEFYNLTYNEHFFSLLKVGSYTFENLKNYVNLKEQLGSRAFVILNNDIVVGLLLEIPKDGYFEMGLWISDKFKGRNYATDATNEYINLHNPGTIIECLVMHDNYGSRKMLEKNNFKIDRETISILHYRRVV